MSHIDVLVTCYNYGRYLRECVESVLAQSHRDVRVLIVDDASTDNTSLICAELVAQDPRVEVLRHMVNWGHITTYNECIDLAHDDHMLLLSADDFLLPGALARAAEVLDAQPDVGLVHGAWLTYRAGDRLPDPASDTPKAERLDAAWFIERLAFGNYVSTATAVVRTSVQKQLGGYRPDLPHAGDLEMWLRFALHSKVAYIAEKQAAYRHHDSNMSLKYGRVSDIEQCVDSFRLHYKDIRRTLPNGMILEARIRRLFAAKQREAAHILRRQGQGSLMLRLQSLRGNLHALALKLLAKFETQPHSRPLR
jgi:glycosyltransferase involved in cell wall biosynthesis